MEWLQELVRLVLVGLAPVVAALITAVLVRVLQRVGLEVQAEHQAKLEKTVQDVILRVEELTAQASNDAGTKVEVNKLDEAVAHLLRLFPKVPPGQLVDLIHQELPKLRIGVGAAAKVVAIGPHA